MILENLVGRFHIGKLLWSELYIALICLWALPSNAPASPVKDPIFGDPEEIKEFTSLWQARQVVMKAVAGVKRGREPKSVLNFNGIRYAEEAFWLLENYPQNPKANQIVIRWLVSDLPSAMQQQSTYQLARFHAYVYGKLARLDAIPALSPELKSTLLSVRVQHDLWLISNLAEKKSPEAGEALKRDRQLLDGAERGQRGTAAEAYNHFDSEVAYWGLLLEYASDRSEIISQLERLISLARALAARPMPELWRQHMNGRIMTYELELTKERMGNAGKLGHLKFSALDGREVDLAALHGKLVLFSFWGTRSEVGISEIPRMAAVYEKYRARGLEGIGIPMEDSRSSQGDRDDGVKTDAKLLSFCQQHGIVWPQYPFDQYADGPLAKVLGFPPVPTYFLVDKEGRLLAKHNRIASLEAYIRWTLDLPQGFSAATKQ